MESEGKRWINIKHTVVVRFHAVNCGGSSWVGGIGKRNRGTISLPFHLSTPPLMYVPLPLFVLDLTYNGNHVFYLTYLRAYSIITITVINAASSSPSVSSSTPLARYFNIHPSYRTEAVECLKWE